MLFTVFVEVTIITEEMVEFTKRLVKGVDLYCDSNSMLFQIHCIFINVYLQRLKLQSNLMYFCLCVILILFLSFYNASLKMWNLFLSSFVVNCGVRDGKVENV